MWIASEIERIGEEKLLELIAAAVEVRSNAYVPYSGYPVGAAVLCSSGEIYAGANTEVVSYSQTGHAESNAINTAINEGEAGNGRQFVVALVVCHSGESAPCGACRQETVEHCDNALVIDVDPEGRPLAVTSLKILLPFSFTPTHLGK
ncbi:MAG TPA: cytidine deaminase [Candidatus Bathyarchaeia archaeon]|nr:cytidine deaminase [Candidatus Bathyarchaeia archaeon]